MPSHLVTDHVSCIMYRVLCIEYHTSRIVYDSPYVILYAIAALSENYTDRLASVHTSRRTVEVVTTATKEDKDIVSPYNSIIPHENPVRGAWIIISTSILTITITTHNQSQKQNENHCK